VRCDDPMSFYNTNRAVTDDLRQETRGRLVCDHGTDRQKSARMCGNQIVGECKLRLADDGDEIVGRQRSFWVQ
jgi:hypothetical protein